MKYAYPAIFTPLDDGGFDVKVPSLPGCRTCGDDLPDAIFMAEDAVSMWLWDAENKREAIPAAVPPAPVAAPQFVSYVYADTDLTLPTAKEPGNSRFNDPACTGEVLHDLHER